MKHLFSDYYLLCGVADKNTRTVGDALRRMSTLMGVPVSDACLSHALTTLVAGGYVTVEAPDGYVTPATSVSLTDAGRAATAVTVFQKLLGAAKAERRNELRFCDGDAAESGDYAFSIDSQGFSEITESLLRTGEIEAGLLTLTEAEGYVTLTLRSSEDGFGGEDDDPDAAEIYGRVSVTGDPARVMGGLSDLLAAIHDFLTKPSTTRKAALAGQDKTLVVTLSRAATASEAGTVLRMTAAPIRFNRHRFAGKRDGDLDYAQCGDLILTVEFPSAAHLAATLLPSAVALPAYLDGDTAAIIHDLHQLLK